MKKHSHQFVEEYDGLDIQEGGGQILEAIHPSAHLQILQGGRGEDQLHLLPESLQVFQYRLHLPTCLHLSSRLQDHGHPRGVVAGVGAGMPGVEMGPHHDDLIG